MRERERQGDSEKKREIVKKEREITRERERDSERKGEIQREKEREIARGENYTDHNHLYTNDIYNLVLDTNYPDISCKTQTQ